MNGEGVGEKVEGKFVFNPSERCSAISEQKKAQEKNPTPLSLLL